MPGWESIERLVAEELKLAREDGRDPGEVDRLEREAAGPAGDPPGLARVHTALLDVPVRADYPYAEPSSLEAIRAAFEPGPRVTPVDADDPSLPDRLHGAWLGRCCGCALGKPVEWFMHPRGELSSRERIRKYLEGAGDGEYPIRDYIPARSAASGRTGAAECPASTRERIAFMETDDDIRYTMIGTLVLQERGLGFTTLDVARAWMEHLPYRLVCTAETQAYRNLVIASEFHLGRDAAPEPDWAWVATHLNPYREWIGAQIRADAYGYAAPGRPALAAELAWRDARLSHTRNGIYGSMLCAAMVAAAFSADSAATIVRAGLGQIPARSRLHEAISWVLDMCAAGPGVEEAYDAIEARLGRYDPVHTINNAALVVAALLLGGDDFGRTIGIAVAGGWDTDCNGATAGSVLGARLGASALREAWAGPLNDTLRSGIAGHDPVSIRACAERSLAIVRTADTPTDAD